MHLAGTLAAIFALWALAVAADDPFVGTWKLNVEKSKTSSGRAAPGSSQTFEATPDGYRISLGSGAAPLILYLDGKEHPRTEGPTAVAVGADMASARRIDSRTMETTFKRGGKTVATILRQWLPTVACWPQPSRESP